MLDRPLVLWDGDCGFCRSWVDYWQSLTGDRVEFAPYQSHADVMAEYGLDEIETSAAMHLLMPDDAVRRGASAVFGTLAHSDQLRHRL